MSHSPSSTEMETAQARLASLREQVISCRRCQRLVEHRENMGQLKKPRYAHWDYWSRPVPGFGDPSAKLMIVGLAPAAHGGNRTGRVFTGDPSATFLMAALHEADFASQPTSEHRDDGLEMYNAYMSAAVRCVPPKDKPTLEEQRNCLAYLMLEIELLPNLQAVLALGHIAFHACIQALKQRGGRPLKVAFAHSARYDLDRSLPTLFASYHPSPRNTNTGRLSKASLVNVLLKIRTILEI